MSLAELRRSVASLLLVGVSIACLATTRLARAFGAQTPPPTPPATISADGATITSWTVGPADPPVRYRGVSAVSDTVAWASGTKGTIVRTADGGRTWQTLSIPGTEALDFRDIDA